LKLRPEPTSDEVAAIVAALEALREEVPNDRNSLKRSRWRLAGLLGRPVPPGARLEQPLWSYASWGGMD
jgi:hypothetical protein